MLTRVSFFFFLFACRAARARPLDAARTYVSKRKKKKKGVTWEGEQASKGGQEGTFAEYDRHAGRIESAGCRLASFQVAKKKTLPHPQ